MTADVLERTDGIRWRPVVRVEKFSPDQCAYADQQIADSLRWWSKSDRRIARQQRIGIGSVYQRMLADNLRLTGEPDDGVTEVAGNQLVNAGLVAITALLTGAGGTTGKYALSVSNGTSGAACGVGSSTTSFALSQTALSADGSTANAYYQVMDSGFPTVSTGVMTGQCTFASGNANFAWNEWCWASGTGNVTAGGTLSSIYGTASSYAMWNRKIASLGTKASGAAWVFTTTITLS
jgi:hypothetical protein